MSNETMRNLTERMNQVSRRSLDGSVVMSSAEWNKIVGLVDELQTARAQSAEPVAEVIPNVVGVEIAWLHPRKAQPEGTKLYTHPPAREQVRLGWFLYGERLPGEDDEDCEGNVWNYMPGRSSVPMLTTAGETRRRYETGIVVHWKPTGLERPELPEE